MLEVSNLSKYYGYHKGIENVSLSCQPGTICGILGHNGSGKTTFFRCLLGVLVPQTGYFKVHGTQKKMNQVFGYVPEGRAMILDITVYEQMLYLGRLRKMKKKDIEIALYKWLSFFSMQDKEHRIIKELSKGNQQKVQFICALLHNPDILILDEPLNGLDGENVIALKQAIELLSKLNKIVLISSHQYEELEELCDAIVLLNRGDVVLEGHLKTLKQEDKRRYVTINGDLGLSYKDYEGVIESRVVNQYARYLFEDDDLANRFCTEIIDNNDITYMLKENISLRDLVIEATT